MNSLFVKYDFNVKKKDGLWTNYGIIQEVFQKEWEKTPMVCKHLMFTVKGLVWLPFF